MSGLDRMSPAWRQRLHKEIEEQRSFGADDDRVFRRLRRDPVWDELSDDDLEDAIDEVELTPNKKASTLRDRPAMDTRFGEDLDDELDEVSGKRGKHLDGAMSRYEVFHSKKPIRVAELDHDLPDSWVRVGECVAVMYRTDKWKSFGNDIDYKHLHDAGDDKPYPIGKGVKFFEPASEAKKSVVAGRKPSKLGKPQRLPVGKPEAITLLGYCLGFFVRRDDDGEIYESNPRGAYLFASPSGNMLTVYSPDEQPDGSSGFLCAMAGGKLRVVADGIDG